jgi:hypothetical protein
MPIYFHEFQCGHRKSSSDEIPDKVRHVHIDDSVTRRVDVSKLDCPACQGETDHGSYSLPESIWYTKHVRTEYKCGHGFNEMQSEHDWECAIQDTGNSSLEEMVFLREGGCGECMKQRHKVRTSGAAEGC